MEVRIKSIEGVRESDPDDLDREPSEDCEVLGVWARAVLEFTVGEAAFEHRVETPGIWGVEVKEDGSEEGHVLQREREQLSDLRDMLAALGLGDWDAIVTVRGGIAEGVEPATVLVVDFDATELDGAEPVTQEIKSMEEKRGEVISANGPWWLVEEIDECLQSLRHRIDA